MVLHHCEHLVAKRICRTFYYTRLPTGHTHDDIDSCFGIVWNYFGKLNTIDTFSKFKAGVEAAFRQEMGLLCEVYEWIIMVPDYVSYYKPYMDQKLSNAFILLDTQHQWKFEAVQISHWFPFGVKTCYRAWTSDKVIEFSLKCKEECLHEIGQATGLEPRTVYVIWRPSVDDTLEKRKGVILAIFFLMLALIISILLC